MERASFMRMAFANVAAEVSFYHTSAFRLHQVIQESKQGAIKYHIASPVVSIKLSAATLGQLIEAALKLWQTGSSTNESEDEHDDD